MYIKVCFLFLSLYVLILKLHTEFYTEVVQDVSYLGQSAEGGSGRWELGVGEGGEASWISQCSRRLCQDQLRFWGGEVLEVIKGRWGKTAGGAERYRKLWSKGEVNYLTNASRWPRPLLAEGLGPLADWASPDGPPVGLSLCLWSPWWDPGLALP